MATVKDEGARMGGGLEANGTLKYFRVELVLWGSLKRLRGEKKTQPALASAGGTVSAKQGRERDTGFIEEA